MCVIIEFGVYLIDPIVHIRCHAINPSGQIISRCSDLLGQCRTLKEKGLVLSLHLRLLRLQGSLQSGVRLVHARFQSCDLCR